jgi:23S rRNA (guanosine2251-2'-O)-methyltransferase
MYDVRLILHNIRSAYNVGAILRTADGAGVRVVYLSGYTPAPIDRFGRARADIAKVALGAESSVTWVSVPDTYALMQQLKQEQVHVVAIEQDHRAVPYTTLHAHHPIALILGEEVAGVPIEICNQCDTIAELPMEGTKESLNVSVTAGIVLYHLLSSRISEK